jgi:hypothetical protein
MCSRALPEFAAITIASAKHSLSATRRRVGLKRTQLQRGFTMALNLQRLAKKMAIAGIAALMLLGIARVDAHAAEPIVGFWAITSDDGHGNIDHIFSGWTSDGLEFDQDVSPVLIENSCYGAWIKTGKRTYGLTHPFFNFEDPNVNGEGTEATEGQWDGTSAVLTYTVEVSKDGTTFFGKGTFKVVQGPNPYDPSATVLISSDTITLSAKKIRVDKSALPAL